MIQLPILAGTLAFLFILCFLSSFGVPGASVAMISTGALAADTAGLIPVIVVASLAAMLGDVVAYEAARRFSSRFSRRLERNRLYWEGERRARLLFEEAGFAMIFFTRWLITTLGAAVNYLTGLARTKRRTFLAAVVTGELLYGTIYPVLGFLFKETWNDLAAVIGGITTTLLLVIVLAASLYFLAEYLKKKRGAERER
jgi:membrane protein DedA with SNARE-associated domain